MTTSYGPGAGATTGPAPRRTLYSRVRPRFNNHRPEASFSVSQLLDSRGSLSVHKATRLAMYLAQTLDVSKWVGKARQHTCTVSPCFAPGFTDPAAAFGVSAGHAGPARGTSSTWVERLLPMALPPRPGCLSCGSRDRIRSPRRRARWAMYHSSLLVTELLISFFNKWEMQDNPTAGGREWHTRPPCALQLAAFEGLHSTVHRSLRLAASITLGSGRGLKTLRSLLDQYCTRWNIVGLDQSSSPVGLSSALPIDVEKLRLPTEAGLLRTETLLPHAEACAFADADARTLPEFEVPLPLPRPCYMVDPHTEHSLRRRLLSTGMAVLIPDRLVAGHEGFPGRRLLNGCFGVPHKHGLRAIFDCRPANQGERRLRWTCLPCGPMLAWLRLRRSEGLRASGDDLSNWFYQLSETPGLVPRRAFGRLISPKEAGELGVKVDEPQRLALKVLGMGSLNAPDIAQKVHETLLERGGCMRTSHVLRYDTPIPTGSDIWEGVYIDDHVVIARLPLSQLDANEGEDRDIIELSHIAYKKNAVAVSEEKAYGFARKDGKGADCRFTVWGTYVDGVRGLARSPYEKTHELACLILVTVAQPRVIKAIVTRLLGLLVHPLMHCRGCSSPLQEVYTWHARLSEAGCARWPPAVKEELLASAMLLFVCEADLRMQASPLVSTTDATPTRGGSTRAVVHPDLANFMGDFSERRGERVRLDWGPEHAVRFPTTMAPPTEFTNDVIRAVPWFADRSRDFHESAHINIQEVREIKEEVAARSSSSLTPQRLANVIDSRVALGAWAKGRSSSRHLNKVLRAGLGFQILGRKVLLNSWCESALNPSDDPSRQAPLRAPVEVESVPRSLTHVKVPNMNNIELVLAESFQVPPRNNEVVCPDTDVLAYVLRETPRHRGQRWCREVFSGYGGLTRALMDRDLRCRAPMEAYPAKRKYLSQYDVSRDDTFLQLVTEVCARSYTYLHFGLPFSKRDHDNWVLVDRTLVLCRLQHFREGLFTIENPEDSMFFNCSLFQQLASAVPLVSVGLDQCCFGLRPPGGQAHEFVRKRTTIVGNFEELRVLGHRCPRISRTHQHVHAVGNKATAGSDTPSTSMARAAGRYPDRLCQEWAACVVLALGARKLAAHAAGPYRPTGLPSHGRAKLDP